jgi:hypothetical protein
MAGEFQYEVKKECGVIGEHGKYSLELRLVSFNGRKEKYDIRTWTTDEEGNERMGKGVTFNEEELQILHDLIEEELQL